MTPPAATAPWTVVAYGPLPDQVAEVTVPSATVPPDAVPPDAAGHLPLVLLLHGGVWREPHDRVHIRPLAAALAATGLVVANVDYRRVDGAGGWPATFIDAALASDTLPDLIEAAGLARVDRTAVVLVGHSAGGHLALWSALRHLTAADAPGHRATPLPVSGVVPLAGVVALSAFHQSSPDADTVERLMGGSPSAVPERYAAADPALLGAPECPVVLVHGSEDEAVPVQTVRDYAAAHGRRGRSGDRQGRGALGGDGQGGDGQGGDGKGGDRQGGDGQGGVTLVELPGTGHFEVIDPDSTAWPAVRDAVHQALGRPTTP